MFGGQIRSRSCAPSPTSNRQSIAIFASADALTSSPKRKKQRGGVVASFEAGIRHALRIGGLDRAQFFAKNGEALLSGGGQQSLGRIAPIIARQGEEAVAGQENGRIRQRRDARLLCMVGASNIGREQPIAVRRIHAVARSAQ